jgi:starch-binding outer membrane protein, SusD/RagB family
MKNLLSTLLISASCVTIFMLPACNRFLEQPSNSVITVDSVFNNPDNAMRALTNVYATCVVNGFITGDGGSGLSDAACFDGLLLAACDEGDQFGTGGRANLFNAGQWGPNNQDEFSIGRVTLGIRNACIFLDNVDKVPFRNTGTINWTPQLKAQTEGEAKILRAMMHYEMMIRYGGIPIIDKTPSVVITDVNGISTATVVPESRRQSLRRTVEFIVKSCDEAITVLPDAYPQTELGRIHKGAAMALKAATLLYAASPLVNTSTPPLSNGNDSLLCMGNADPSRWQVAAAANKAVIDWSIANGYALLDDAALGKSESYNYATGACLDPRNREVLLFNRSHGQQAGGANMVRWTCPIYFSWGNVVHAMPMNYVRIYRDVNGADISIPDNGTFPQLKSIMRRFEPRFHATAWWPGSLYTNTGLMNTFGGADTAKFLYRQGSANGNFIQTGAGAALIGQGVPNGFHVKKFTNLVNALNGRLDSYWPIFRLSEFYLNYAEALNETDPGNLEILNALNIIRRRGGIPNLTSADPAFGNRIAMRALIQRERSIELYGEEHRFFDVRRWKIAGNDGVMRGDFQRIFLFENGTGTYAPPTAAQTPAQRLANDSRLSYRIERFETRVWEDKMYFYPFPQGEVNKGFLVQNPGW